MPINKPNKIIIHCSATPEGKNFNAEWIKNIHINEKNFDDIGYHYVILLDGSLEKGRLDEIIGAHCSGQNTNSIGICYIGGCDKNLKSKDTRTDAQKKSLKKLVAKLQNQYNISNLRVYGHNEFSNKDCPCFNVRKEWF